MGKGSEWEIPVSAVNQGGIWNPCPPKGSRMGFMKVWPLEIESGSNFKDWVGAAG